MCWREVEALFQMPSLALQAGEATRPSRLSVPSWACVPLMQQGEAARLGWGWPESVGHYPQAF